jgi:hypothetical protein
VLAQTYRLFRWIFFDLPMRLVPWPAVRALLKSWPFQLFYSVFLLPLLVCGVLWWFFPEAFQNRWRAAAIFVAIEVLFNSRPGQAAGDAATRGSLRVFDWFRSGLIPGLFRFIVRFFKQITDAVEYVLYSVDEWLRFRTGDNRFSMVVRAFMGLVWFPVSYLTRLYLVVLIEPGFNPLKMPISILAAKFVYPIIITLDLATNLTEALQPFLGAILAYAFVGATLWLLPDAFGFLIWEMKENWRLYRANRAAYLGAVSIGPRGETLLNLLQPGFHTGTLPKLYAQWRYAGRQAYETGAWRTARACREALVEVEEAIHRFLEREVLALLHQSPGWQKRPLSIGEIALASNLIRITLRHSAYPEKPLGLTFAERDGRLVAAVEEPGFLAELPPAEQSTLARALEGMYNLAGIDWVADAGAPPPIAWKDWVQDWRRDEVSDGQPESPPAPAIQAAAGVRSAP